MPSYCVYGDLTQDVKDLSVRLRITDPEVLHWAMDEMPHSTLFFGPQLVEGEEEVLKSEDVGKVLPGFVEKYKGCLPKYEIRGVSYFNNEKFNVVKIDLESPEMTDMQVFLRGTTLNNYAKMYEETGKESYALPPKNWCHITLGYIKKDANIDKIVHNLYQQLKDEIGTEHQLESISLISAIQDKSIKLW